MPGRKLKEEKELFYSFLRQNGLKKTHQKDLILETFLCNEGHLSVEDIYSLVKKKDRKVGIVTVFRTLKSLTACGIAREITLGDGLTRFEHCYHHPHHHHIVCTECQKVIEFMSPDLEGVQEEVVRRYDFHPSNQRIQIYGICRDCRENRPAVEAPKHDTEKVFARDALKMAAAVEKDGIEFYRDAMAQNRDPGGMKILERIIAEEEAHLSRLEEMIRELNRVERGLEQAPMFLHFDPQELRRLIPDLGDYKIEGELRLDARRALDLAIMLERRAAEFFKEYAEKFGETEGKKILQDFAEEELKHCSSISRQAEAASGS